MKKSSFLAASALVLAAYVSCGKDYNPPKLNDMERRLLGKWGTIRITYEKDGQPPRVENVTGMTCYYIVFKADIYPLRSDGLYSGTRWAEDQKDCSKRLNAWKLEGNGQLLLASLDTTYADILILEEDTLAFRATNPAIPDEHIVYEFR